VSVYVSVCGLIPVSGEKGSTVLATKPTILVCDLALLSGDSQTCQSLISFTSD